MTVAHDGDQETCQGETGFSVLRSPEGRPDLCSRCQAGPMRPWQLGCAVLLL